MKPRVHLELDRPGRRSRPTDRPERSPHLEGRPTGPACVLLAVVEQQQRVAAELEQAATLCVGDAEERGERGVHHLGDFLGPRSAEARETLRHGGEAGDVDEGDRALDLAPRCRRLVSKPFQRQSGYEWDKVGRRRGERVGRGRRHRVGFSSTGGSGQSAGSPGYLRVVATELPRAGSTETRRKSATCPVVRRLLGTRSRARRFELARTGE